MDKSYFLETGNPYEPNKMEFKFTEAYSGIDVENYASKTVILQFYNLLAHYRIEYNRHIDKIDFHLDSGEGNARIIYLDVYLNEGEISKAHLREARGILQLIQSTPRNNVKISGKEVAYSFTLFNITDEINEHATGVYIFTITIPDIHKMREHTHCLIKFNAIEDSNKDAIEYSKKNGALHFLYYPTVSLHEMNKIIEDIQTSSDYLFQVSIRPDLTIE